MATKKSFDKYPQFLNIEVDETAANTYSPTDCPTNLTGNQIMNILKLFVSTEFPEIVNIVETKIAWHLSKKKKDEMGELAESDVIMRDEKVCQVVDTAATDATVAVNKGDKTKIYDLSDGNGHGYLYAGKNLFLAVKGTGNVGAKYARIKVLYTIVTVSAEELTQLLRE